MGDSQIVAVEPTPDNINGGLATDQFWDEIVDVVNGKQTLSVVLGGSQFAIHRIGPLT